LIFTEAGELVSVVEIGGVPHYAVPDKGFLRHVEAERVDRQVVALLQEQFQAMKDVIAAGVTQLTGHEDLFTRAAIEHAIENMDRILEAGNVDVDQLRTALWMMKFRAIVDVHGDAVRLDLPGWQGEGDDI
jgi:hypothetical protein